MYHTMVDEWEAEFQHILHSTDAPDLTTDEQWVEAATVLAEVNQQQVNDIYANLDFTCGVNPCSIAEYDAFIQQEESSTTRSSHVWITTNVKAGFKHDHTPATQVSLLVDSGCPPALVMSRQQLPQDAVRRSTDSLKVPLLVLNVCSCRLHCTERAVVTIQLGDIWVTTVAAVYDQRSLPHNKKFPPLLGQAFNAKHGISLVVDNVSNQQQRVPRNPVTTHANMTTSTTNDQPEMAPIGYLARVYQDGRPSERLISVFPEPDGQSNSEHFTFLAQCPAQCRNVRPVTILPGNITRILAYVTAGNNLSEPPTDLRLFTNIDTRPDLQCQGLEIMPVLLQTQSEEDHVVLPISNVGDTPITLPADLALCTLRPVQETERVDVDSSGQPVRLTTINGRIALYYDPEVRADALYAEAAELLRDSWDFSTPLGQQAVEKLRQRTLLQAMARSVSIESEEDLVNFLLVQIEELKGTINQRISAAERQPSGSPPARTAKLPRGRPNTSDVQNAATAEPPNGSPSAPAAQKVATAETPRGSPPAQNVYFATELEPPSGSSLALDTGTTSANTDADHVVPTSSTNTNRYPISERLLAAAQSIPADAAVSESLRGETIGETDYNDSQTDLPK